MRIPILVGAGVLVFAVTCAFGFDVAQVAEQQDKCEVLVKFVASIRPEERSRLESENALKLVSYHKSIDVYHYRSSLPDLDKLLQSLRSSPLVVYAEPNYSQRALSNP